MKRSDERVKLKVSDIKGEEGSRDPYHHRGDKDRDPKTWKGMSKGYGTDVITFVREESSRSILV